MHSKYAIVTGASTGIGRELAIIAARDGYDLLLAADTAGLVEVARGLPRRRRQRRHAGGRSRPPRTASTSSMRPRRAAPVDALFANAGHGLGRAFLDQEFDEVRHVIDTNITGTIYLVQQVARDMLELGEGRILITGSVAGYMPGTFQAVYNGTKAFIDSFSFALRNELKDSGVTVTCLMPGATDTEFFERADMLDTRVATDDKDDPAYVAQVGYDAMIRGDGDVVAGWKNKLQTAVASVTPSAVLAEQHRKMAEPGTARTRTAGRD